MKGSKAQLSPPPKDAPQSNNWIFIQKNDDIATGNTSSPFNRENYEDGSVTHNQWSKQSYESALSLYNSFVSCSDSYISTLVNDSLKYLSDAYRLYGPDNVICSFNGGKDAAIIMELCRAVHAKFYYDLQKNMDGVLDENSTVSTPVKMIRPRVIYFNDSKEFPEVYDFVRSTVNNYDLDMVAFEEGIGFKNGLQILVDCNKGIPLSFVLGTRSSDPNARGQGVFAPSSSYMPPFMRVNPVLDWNYGHVWHLLRLYKLPYCSLYDEGYTSLGSVLDTMPCPALRKVHVISEKSDTQNIGDGNNDKNLQYWPAYMLRDWDQERAGRIKLDKTKKYPASTMSQVTPGSTINNGIQGNKNQQTNKNTADIAVPDSVFTKTITFDTSKVHEKLNQTERDTPSSSSSTSSNTQSRRTVGLLIIGDEILKGDTQDINTHVAASALRSQDVPLAKVVVVSDNKTEIVSEIQRMSVEVDIIITSGGIGPTHDDVTIKSVSEALGSHLVLHEGMANLLKKKMNTDVSQVNGNADEDSSTISEGLTDVQIKMATLPSCSKLRYLSNNKDDWPVLQCRNIFVLPGVPQFFEKKVVLVASYLSTESERTATFRVVLTIDEVGIVSLLNSVVKNHPNVSFGSYPFVDHPEFKTVVTLEARRYEGGYVRNSGKFLEIPDDDTINDDLTGLDDGNEDSAFNRVRKMSYYGEFTKEQMDIHVKVALSDLVNRMPKESVLRVENQ